MQQYRVEADVLIEPETSAQYRAIDRVHLLAFGQEGEGRLVRALREQGYTKSELSLVAAHGSEVVGHVLLSTLRIVHDDGELGALALAPVAVIPKHQGRGIGSKLIRAGLERARLGRWAAVVVLGEPNFYGRFDFSAELAKPISSPYAGPHFMVLELVPHAVSSLKNARAIYPPPFSQL